MRWIFIFGPTQMTAENQSSSTLLQIPNSLLSFSQVTQSSAEVRQGPGSQLPLGQKMKRISLLFFVCLGCSPRTSYQFQFFVQDNQGNKISNAWIRMDDKPVGKTDENGFFVATQPLALGAQPKITAGKEASHASYAPYTERVEITPQTQPEILLTVTLYAMPKVQQVSTPAIASVAPVAAVPAATVQPMASSIHKPTAVPAAPVVAPAATEETVRLEAVPIPRATREPLLVIEPHVLPHLQREKEIAVHPKKRKKITP